MRAAARRLEALLKDAGPNIVVTPVGTRAPDALMKAEIDEAAILASLPGVEPMAEAAEIAIPPSAPQPAETAGAGVAFADPERTALGRIEPIKVPAAEIAQPAARTCEPEPSTAAGLLMKKAEALVSRISKRLTGDTSAAPPLPQPAAKTKAQDQPVSGKGELYDAIYASKREFKATAAFSFVINILMLTGPIFMLQVYDRVMTSGSLPTLVVLTLITVGLYAITGALELVRTRVIVRVGSEIESRVSERIFKASLRRAISAQNPSGTALRELDHLRQFISGQGPLTFFDAPWTPVYLFVIFMVHWVLGVAALGGALLLLGLTWASEMQTRTPLSEANKATGKSLEIAETGQRNAEALTAMGMLGAYRGRWLKANSEAMSWQIRTADTLGTFGAISKTLRLLMQSLMLALGAGLAVHNDISAGSIIAATIIFGRALAPVEQAIGHWRSFLKARESYGKLDELLKREPEPARRTALPAPKGKLEVQGLRVASPETRQLIITNVTFNVEPGQMLAVIGPSASGKSTLARSLVGLWPPFAGAVMLDSARLDQWDAEALGRHIGYLPQNVDLFAGTVKENIARFSADATDEEIVAAAMQAHAHELVLGLPQGYETQVGAFATYLSSGQRQRIALARALFRNPALVVLDEPNSNLDRAGDEALSAAIDGMRARGQAIVLVSHRVQAIGKADLLLYIDRGVQRAFGPRLEVMRMFQQGSFENQANPASGAAAAQASAAQAGAAKAAAAAAQAQAATSAPTTAAPGPAASAPEAAHTPLPVQRRAIAVKAPPRPEPPTPVKQ
jgi:PrtD family type I secretion system ABC transporter